MAAFGSNWAVLTAAFLMVLYIAQGGVVLSALVHLSHVAGARWRADIAPFAHQTVRFFPLALALLIILLTLPEATFPYYRTSNPATLNAWHNYPFLVVRELGLLLLVAGINYGFVRASVRDHYEHTPASRQRLTRFAAVVPFLYMFYGTVVAWDFEMTLIPGWHSPIYSVYFFISNFHMFLGFFVLVLYLLRVGRRPAAGIARQSFNYLAQMMLGLTLLWTYMFFVQFLTIWYGNMPHETGRLYALIFADADIRRGPAELAAWFWWFVILKSFIPFGLLIFAVVRHTPGLTALVGGIIFIGTGIERYTWIAGAYPAADMPLGSLFISAVVILVGSLIAVVLRSAFPANGKSLVWGGWPGIK